ncbi:MAG: PAS domain S-box protein [Nitrospirae bacterium]|nr:PAS domain S-box protein [Candidatus Manganitrophaceae bacterium]
MKEETLFRLVFEQVTVGMAILAVDPIGRYIAVNPAFCRMTGYSREELLSRDFQSITAEEDVNRNIEEIRSLLVESVPSLQIEKRYLRKGGDLFWARLKVSLLRDDRGTPTSLLVQIEDIGTQKKTEEALQETDQTLRPLIKASPLGIVTLDLDLNVKMWNPAAERLFGWRAEEILGRPNPVVPPEEAAEFRGYVARLLEGGPAFVDTPKRRLRKDGGLIDVRVSTALLRGADGGVSGIMGIFADVTEQKRLEVELRHAQKLEGIGQLAGGVAHEFNNILTAIIGNVELILEDADPGSRLQATLARVEQAAHRAAALTQQLLTFSRRSRVDLKPLDLRAVAEEVVCLLGQTFDRRIAFALRSSEGIWPVLADAGQMNQVFMNLCVNARDALMERLEKPVVGEKEMDWSPRIEIQVENISPDPAFLQSHPEAKSERYLHLLVFDNGCGMDEAIRHRIFEPFFTTKATGRGTGLGLAAVYGIIQQHQGWIEVRSVKNEGTFFHIYLPAIEGVAVPEGGKGDETSAPGGNETILFIDDEAEIRRLANTVLSQYGYRLLFAKDGIEAIERFRVESERIDLIILDLTMPGRSGEEVFRELRALAPTMKILVSSGHSPAGRDKEIPAEKTIAFILKPYRPDALARAVRSLLDR